MGLIMGFITAIATLFGSSLGAEGSWGVGAFGGVLAIILVPLLYALMGLIFGYIGGFIINLALKITKGIKYETGEEAMAAAPAMPADAGMVTSSEAPQA